MVLDLKKRSTNTTWGSLDTTQTQLETCERPVAHYDTCFIVSSFVPVPKAGRGPTEIFT